MNTNNTIDKIGNIYFNEWKPGFDGNICGVKGIYPTITLSNNTGGGIVRVCLKRTLVWNLCINAGSVLLTLYGLIPTTKKCGKGVIYTILAGVSSRNYYYVAVEL